MWALSKVKWGCSLNFLLLDQLNFCSELSIVTRCIRVSPNIFTEFREFNYYLKKELLYYTRIHCLLCERQRFYHCDTQKIFKLIPIHASVIHQIPWIRWIQWKFCFLLGKPHFSSWISTHFTEMQLWKWYWIAGQSFNCLVSNGCFFDCTQKPNQICNFVS